MSKSQPQPAPTPLSVSAPQSSSVDNGQRFHKILDDKLSDALLSVWEAYQSDLDALRQDIAHLRKQVGVYSNVHQRLQHENAHLKHQLNAIQQQWPAASGLLFKMKPSEPMAPEVAPVPLGELPRTGSNPNCAGIQPISCQDQDDPLLLQARNGLIDWKADCHQQPRETDWQQSTSEESSKPTLLATPRRSPHKKATFREIEAIPPEDVSTPSTRRTARTMTSMTLAMFNASLDDDVDNDEAVEDEDLSKRGETSMEIAGSKSLEERDKYVRQTFRNNSQFLDENHISRMMDLEHDAAQGFVKILVYHFAAWMDWWHSLEEPEPENTDFFARFLQSDTFMFVSNMAIILNFAFVGYAANHRVQHYENDEDGSTVYIGATCLYAYFTCEVILKLLVHKTWFFCNVTAKWNVFDLLLALFATYDRWDNQYSDKVAFLRCMRVLKLCARLYMSGWIMRWTPELKIIIGGILGSVHAIAWSCVLLISVYYTFGVVFSQGAATYLYMNKDNEATELTLGIRESFGSVRFSMMSLLMASTGGDDWGTYYPMIEATGMVNAIFFVSFIAFIQIMIFNLLTGVFVDATIKGAEPDREAKALQLRKQDLIAEAELLRILKGMDANGDHTIDYKEFSTYLKSDKFKSYLKLNGLDMTERDAKLIFFKAKRQFGIDGPLKTEDFLSECLKLKGEAKTLDLWRFMQMQEMISDEIMTRLDALEQACAHIEPQDLDV